MAAALSFGQVPTLTFTNGKVESNVAEVGTVSEHSHLLFLAGLLPTVLDRAHSFH